MYEYTDDDNDNLHVEPLAVLGKTYVGTVEDNGLATGVLIRNEDAPAIALAILEAAGIEGWNYSDDRLSSAVIALTEHKRQQDAKAAREAEDAKAKAYRDALFPGAVKWEHLDEEIRETHRTRYRAARRFFKEA